MTMTTFTPILAIIGMVLAAGALILEMRGRIDSKSKVYLFAFGAGSFLLMLRAISLGEPSFIVLEGLKSFAAFTAIFFPRSEVAEHLIEDMMLI
ncbi:MAG: hypothetical protein VW230_02615 [Candidatus Poseidoniales archaeon]